MNATLNLTNASEWIEACIAEWESEFTRTQESYWKGRVDAARVIQDAFLSGEFEATGAAKQPLIRWVEGDRVDLYLRDSESKAVVVGATVKLFDDQGVPLRSAWTGTQGVTYYALLPADTKKDTLQLRFRVPGYLPAMVSIPNGKKSVVVAMMPNTQIG
jgi:hypothetical protein